MKIKTELHFKHVDYDEESDVLYLFKGKPASTINRSVSLDILLRFDPKAKELVGLTITNASQHFPTLRRNQARKDTIETIEHLVLGTSTSAASIWHQRPSPAVHAH